MDSLVEKDVLDLGFVVEACLHPRKIFFFFFIIIFIVIVIGFHSKHLLRKTCSSMFLDRCTVHIASERYVPSRRKEDASVGFLLAWDWYLMKTRRRNLAMHDFNRVVSSFQTPTKDSIDITTPASSSWSTNRRVSIRFRNMKESYQVYSSCIMIDPVERCFLTDGLGIEGDGLQSNGKTYKAFLEPRPSFQRSSPSSRRSMKRSVSSRSRSEISNGRHVPSCSSRVSSLDYKKKIGMDRTWIHRCLFKQQISCIP